MWTSVCNAGELNASRDAGPSACGSSWTEINEARERESEWSYCQIHAHCTEGETSVYVTCWNIHSGNNTMHRCQLSYIIIIGITWRLGILVLRRFCKTESEWFNNWLMNHQCEIAINCKQIISFIKRFILAQNSSSERSERNQRIYKYAYSPAGFNHLLDWSQK